MKKLAIIRDNDNNKCPYNLDVIGACSVVGDAVLTMKPIELANDDEVEDVKKNNQLIYMTKQTGERCPFANEIMKQFDKVDCSYGDSAAGEHGGGHIPASPLYPRTFIGDGVHPNPRSGQDITDPRLFFDEPQRGIDVPFGLFSVFSDKDNENELLKIARYTNNSVDIKSKVDVLRNKYFDTLKLIVPNNIAIKLSEKQLTELLVIINEWVK